MAETINLQIITPEKLFYEGEVEIVIVRTPLGEEGFMANHIWACKLLDIGELWLRESGQKEYKVAAVAGGFIDVKDEIMIFVDAAEWPSEINVERQNATKLRAEERLNAALTSTGENKEHEILEAKKSIKKAENRLNVHAGGKKPRK